MSKSVKVQMLPTRDEKLAIEVMQSYEAQKISLGTNGLITPSHVTIGNGLIKSITSELAYVVNHPYNIREWQAQHLYFTSDEEIKGGDCIIRTITGHISRANKEDVSCWLNGYKFCTKAVSSTDPSLGLPLIPTSFIEKYVASNGKIDEVELETELDKECLECHNFGDPWDSEFYHLKLTKDNEVIVKS